MVAQETPPLEYLFSLQQKEALVRVELVDEITLQGFLVGLDEHINLVLRKKLSARSTVYVVYGHNVVSVSAVATETETEVG